MTDHGTNMFGAGKDFIRQVYEAYENVRCLKPAVIHCIVHQQLPRRKYLNLSCVNEPLGSVLNFTFSCGLNHHQFHEFLSDIRN